MRKTEIPLGSQPGHLVLRTVTPPSQRGERSSSEASGTWQGNGERRGIKTDTLAETGLAQW